MNDIVCHIGAPKTATTTLKKHSFPHLKDIFYLGNSYARDDYTGEIGWYFLTEELGHLFHQIEHNNLDFQMNDAQAKEQMKRIENMCGEKTVVLSNENISIFSGPDPITKITRYKSLFDDTFDRVKLIYCVRNQLDLLTSFYQTVHRNNMLYIDKYRTSDWAPSFQQWIDINVHYSHESLLNCFKFDFMIQKYTQIFGKENIFIYTFDEFKEDAPGVLERLCDFMGIRRDDDVISGVASARESVRESKRTYAYRKIRHRVLRSISLSRVAPGYAKLFRDWLQRSPSMHIEPNSRTVERIRGFYAKDNAELELKMGIQLVPR